MNSYLLFVILGVSAWRVSLAVSCTEISSCPYDEQQYADALSRGDISTLCNMLGNTVQCMERAMEHCVFTGSLPDDKLSEAQMTLENNKQQLNAFCPGTPGGATNIGGPHIPSLVPPEVPTHPACRDIMDCMFDAKLFQTAMDRKRLDEACTLINPSVKCLKMAIKDCQKMKLFNHKEEIDKATEALHSSEKLLEANCGYTPEDDSMESSESAPPNSQSGNPNSAQASSSEGDQHRGAEQKYHTDIDDDFVYQGETGSQTDYNENGADTNGLSLIGVVFILAVHIRHFNL